MSNEMEAAVSRLVNAHASHNAIRAIGMSGGERPFPKPGEGDIDLFVYCTEIPAEDERKAALTSIQDDVEHIEIGKLAGGHWGKVDCLSIAGIETWLLYFTVDEAHLELEAILGGNYLERLDNYYYPIGRCAMWKTMRALYDPDGFLQGFKQRLVEYPKSLQSVMVCHHLKALDDVEDLERAVSRKDVFFFHFALDLALDHFLQALFALNKEYFPSRKRSEIYIRGFKIKPAECERRLYQVIALGGSGETLEQSYELWKDLVCDLNALAEHQ